MKLLSASKNWLIIIIVFTGLQQIKAEQYTVTDSIDADSLQWSFIRKLILNEHFYFNQHKVGVKLDKSVTAQDSIYITELMNEINSIAGWEKFILTYTWSIKAVIEIRISNEKDCGANGVSILRLNVKHGRYKTVCPFYCFPDSLNQNQRNQLLRYRIGRSVLNLDFSTVKMRKTFVDLPNEGLLGEAIFLTSFTKQDKELLSKVHAKHRNWNYLLSDPNGFVQSVKRRHGYNADFTFRVFTFLILGLYFLWLFKRRLLEVNQKGFRAYQGQLVLISLAFGVLLFLQMIYVNNIFIQEPWYTIPIVLFGYWIIAYVLGLILFLVESSLRKKDNTPEYIIKRLLLSTVLSVGVLLVLNIFGNPKLNLIGDWIVFVLAVQITRAVMTFQDYKLKTAVKEKDIELMRLQNLQQQSELQAIHSRINPHFLYNSLNSIASLARSIPEKSEQMALALSDFCRYSINKKNEKFTSLGDELETVKNYLSIEQIRFGDKLQFTITCPEELYDTRIPRFIVQPLVENAIKHALSELTGKGILSIEIMQEENIIIAVGDNGKPFPDEPVYGFGLQSIYDKLELLYKGKAKMNWQNEPIKKIILYIPTQLKR